ncbi:RING/FYVE/PHD zinc finger superfamily protein [Carex rostrata]
MRPMMVLNLENLPKRKRGEVIFRFESFCEPGYPTRFTGLSFRENIETLLGFGSAELTGTHGEAKFWSFQLELNRHPPTTVRLIVVEEDVKKSSCRQCRYCRFIGWGEHLICNKRFHFVLPRKETMIQAPRPFIEMQHLLHGVVHLNGFGHLLSINGFSGGSEFVSGHQLLEIWDRICVALCVRKVSLSDIAKKDNMHLRLLYGVAYGKTWFNQWGYEFARPTYAVTYEMYSESLETLKSFPLHLLVPQLARRSREIPFIVAKYQAISTQQLVTLGELFKFMLEFKSRLPFNSLAPMDYSGIISENTSRWSAKRVEMAARVIVEALKRSELRWVTRQEVRDTARTYIGDTGLLDFVLKSLGNHIVGNYIVRRMVNPVTKVLEYCLEDLSSVLPPNVNGNNGRMRVRLQMTRVQVIRDLSYLYRQIFVEAGKAVHPNGALGAMRVATRMVMDTKHFVKDYQSQDLEQKEVANLDCINLNCTICVRNGGKNPVMKQLPCYEIVTVSNNATIGELKLEVQRCFREIYMGLNNFVAESIIGYGGLDSYLVYDSISSKDSIVTEGSIEHTDVNGIYEGGNDIVVNCMCGARDEDGERLICCDICEVWQHSRCVGVSDTDQIPQVFLCNRCENGIVSLDPLNF